jgi:hypothetical protein
MITECWAINININHVYKQKECRVSEQAHKRQKDINSSSPRMGRQRR